MTKFSTDRTGAHEASVFGMTWSGGSTEGADVFGALGANVLGGLALETLYHGGSGGLGVQDDDGVIVSSRLHNHLQSSGEHNMSSAHSKSTSSVSPSPASLSWHRVMTILFLCGKGGGS